jgi:hypothetical protein
MAFRGVGIQSHARSELTTRGADFRTRTGKSGGECEAPKILTVVVLVFIEYTTALPDAMRRHGDLHLALRQSDLHAYECVRTVAVARAVDG